MVVDAGVAPGAGSGDLQFLPDIQGRHSRLRHRHAGCHHSPPPPSQAPKSHGAVWLSAAPSTPSTAAGRPSTAAASRCSAASRAGVPAGRRHVPRPASGRRNHVRSCAYSIHNGAAFSSDTRRRACALHGRWILLPLSDAAHFVGALNAWVGLWSQRVGHIIECRVLSPRSNRDDYW